MRKAIQLFLSDDEEQQLKEQSLSATINKNFAKSLMCFKRIVPAVHDLIKGYTSSHHSVYINADNEIDIVDYRSGNVFYGANISSSICQHVHAFIEKPRTLAIEAPNDSDQITKITNESVIVSLGVGIGLHILELLKRTDARHLIIYESNLDVFLCSLYSGVWPRVFDMAAKNGVTLYLQVPNDGQSLYSDLQKLKAFVGLSHYVVYFHNFSENFDSLFNQLKTANWYLQRELRQLTVEKTLENRIPQWPPVVNDAEWETIDQKSALFNANVEAFRRYFPEIADEFENFSPKYWDICKNTSGEINAKNISYSSFLMGNEPKKESAKLYELFKEYPNKDELVLGYAGGKLAPHYHYRTVISVQEALYKYNNERKSLGKTIKSLVMFGLGLGYQLELLLSSHDVEKLFLYEPNSDFFYASLFSIDWTTILEKFEKQNRRLYLNIGDNGSNLVQDFLSQFHTVGSYHLASTYLFKSYDNEVLEPVLANLREDLKLIVGLGDNFENARYIIAHSKWAIENDTKFLAVSQSRFSELAEVPVFIVGNGPSLDGLFPLIKEHKNNVIIISCGTALQALHKHGVVPDYHADLEVNRSTYDWTVRIKDQEYLKNVKLISGNGVHPDTASLYKKTFLSLKNGEAATLMLTTLMEDIQFTLLKNSYPTVSNFAIDFVTEAGFKQIYLLGVDMGFVDVNHHHSKDSGYYTSAGKELYNYQTENNTSITVEGNLRPYVKTKYEFKLSKTIIERTLLSSDAEVYNLNDGAKINGATPLDPSNVLITSSSERKTKVIEWLESEAFQTVDKALFDERFKEKIKNEDLLDGIGHLKELCSKAIDKREDVEQLVSRQREILFDYFRAGKPVLLYYMNGSVNYINTALSKTLNVTSESDFLSLATEVLRSWNSFLGKIFESMKHVPYEPDFITSFPELRQQAISEVYFKTKCFSVESTAFNSGLVSAKTSLGLHQDACTEGNERYVISRATREDVVLSDSRDLHCYVVNDESALLMLLDQRRHKDRIVFIPSYFDDVDWKDTAYDSYAHFVCYIAFIAISCDDSIDVIIPKLPLSIAHKAGQKVKIADTRLKQFYKYEAYHFVALSRQQLRDDAKVSGTGDRVRFVAGFCDDDLICSQIEVKS